MRAMTIGTVALLALCGVGCRPEVDERVEPLVARVVNLEGQVAGLAAEQAKLTVAPDLGAPKPAPRKRYAFIPPMPCDRPSCFVTISGHNACWCSAGSLRYCIVFPERRPCEKSDDKPPVAE